MTDPTDREPPAALPLGQEVELPAVPSLGRSYLRALAAGLRKRPEHAATLSVTVPPRRLDLAHLQRYRRLTGFTDPRTVPPTYPHVLAVPLHLGLLTHRAFPARALGLVHTEQRIEVLGVLDPDQPLGLSARVGAPTPARRGQTFTVETTATAGGEVVWRGLTTVLAPAPRPAPSPPKAPDAGAAQPPAPASPPPLGQPGQGEEPDVEVSLLWSLPADLGRRYARVGGDYNPIHLSALTARIFGFKRAIAHGMWSMARSLAAVEDLAPAAPARYTVTFRRPLFLPSRVRFAAARRHDGVDLQLLSERTGKLHLHGRVEAL